MTIPKLNVRGPEVRECIRYRVPFTTTTGNLRGGGEMPSGWNALGRLPGERVHDFERDRDRIDYIVWSYGTPIAWHLDWGAWVVPEERYSVTTSRHQGIVRWATGAMRAAAMLGSARPVPTAQVVARESARALASVRDRERQAAEWAEVDRQYQQDDFAPDNGAPVETWHAGPHSGEGALYSLERLAAVHGRAEH